MKLQANGERDIYRCFSYFLEDKVDDQVVAKSGTEYASKKSIHFFSCPCVGSTSHTFTHYFILCIPCCYTD